jgi:hypothetical protein
MMKGKPEQDTPSIDLHPVLFEAWSKGFSVKADFSRTRAAEVAAACRLGLHHLATSLDHFKPKERKQG